VERTGNLSLRTALPEVQTAAEALTLATREFPHLSTREMKKLAQMLKRLEAT
jgi:hypothetical protein